LGRLEIVEDLEYLLTCEEQRVLQRSHIAQLSYLFVLLTVVTKPLITLVIFTRHDPSTRRATPLSFTHGYFVHGALLVFSETCVASKMSIACKAGDSLARKCARVAECTVATRLVAGVRDVTST